MLVGGTLCLQTADATNVGISDLPSTVRPLCWLWITKYHRALMGPMSKNPRQVALSTASTQMGAVADLCIRPSQPCRCVCHEATSYSVVTLLFNAIMVICMVIVARATRDLTTIC